MYKTMLVQAEPNALLAGREEIGWSHEQVQDHFSSAKDRRIYGVDAEYLAELETEKLEVPFGLLTELSKLYDKPVAFFFSSTARRTDWIPSNTDKRTFVATEDRRGSITRDTILEVKHAKGVQTFAAEHMSDFYIDGRTLPRVQAGGSPVVLASRYRRLLGLDTYSRKRAKHKDYFEFIRSRIESLGIIVLQTSMSKEDNIRGLAFTDKRPYLILINKRDGFEVSYAPRLFTLAHEFCHVLLRDDSVCDENHRSTNQTEIFCNRFAANLLLPEQDFHRAFEELRLQRSQTTLIQKIEELRNRYCVSFDSVAWRLRELGFISENAASSAIQDWRKQQEENFVPPKIGHIKPETIVKNALGDTLPRELIKRENQLAPLDVLSILNTRLDDLGNIRRAFS